jgi:hypothetical protein
MAVAAPKVPTICGYELADVRRALRDAIDRRDSRTAFRWAAELVATPGAIGSLWAACWLSWATITGSASPTLPILLRQDWDKMTTYAYAHDGDWVAFRNDPPVRAAAAEIVTRLLAQIRQTPVIWPSKEIVLYDIGTFRESPVPAAADGPIAMRVWQRGEDALDVRIMAGYWLEAIRRGDLRAALSVVAWTLMTPAQQGHSTPLKFAERGPATLPPRQRASPIWFWLEIGRALLISRGEGLHRGWMTMHSATADAFRQHFKRWTAAERMRVLLAWIIQIRSAFQPAPEGLWSADPIRLTIHEIDLPYKEIAAELADPDTAIIQHQKAPTAKTLEADGKKAAVARAEAKMAEADAKILAMMGLSEDDV